MSVTRASPAAPVSPPSAPRLEVSPAARRFPVLLVGGLIIVAVLVVLHVGVGPVYLSPRQVVLALIGHPEIPYQHTIVVELRLPRALIALAAGAMLALAGAILQSIMRNPLAEPEMTGSVAGAILVTVLWVGFGESGVVPAVWYMPLVALAGGVAAGLVVYVLTWRGQSQPGRLILTGLLVSAILRSGASIVLLVHQAAIGSVMLWLIGSLNGRVWSDWGILWPWALPTLLLGLASARWANVLQLGDETAASLGLRVEWARAALLFLAVALAAGAVAIVGGIAFLGLVAPHLARRVTGADARRVFPLSMVIGAGILVGADIVAQVALPGIQLPVGAVVAVLGAPFFLYLLRRRLR
ncbi:MAG TPA: iron ABC transporter permease [Thermomicrobiaceae bacterium]|nr:iron ABC transporter permease [Thermomicrobiaceae bacterium]